MKPPAKIISLEARSERQRSVPSLRDREDDELMLLARGGADGAFDELVRRYQRQALRIASRHTGSDADAPDIVQCAFLELYKEVPRYEPRGRLASYLYRIVINQCRMANRSRRSQRKKHTAASTSELPPQSHLADEAILAKEKRREVDRALERLSDKLRDVVVLRFAGELSYREIADTLELPVGTVKSRLFAALGRLAIALGEDAP